MERMISKNEFDPREAYHGKTTKVEFQLYADVSQAFTEQKAF
jgi:hypothetical protein